MFKSIISKHFILFSIYIIFNTASYSETKFGLNEYKINPQSKIEFTSNSMTFNSKNGEANFFDNVLVTYGQLRLSAQKLVITQSTNEEQTKQLVFSASGPIEISNENSFIYGDQAEFIGEKQELTILGNVQLNQRNNIITGDKLILNLQNGVAKISGAVRTIINTTGKLQ